MPNKIGVPNTTRFDRGQDTLVQALQDSSASAQNDSGERTPWCQAQDRARHLNLIKTSNESLKFPMGPLNRIV